MVRSLTDRNSYKVYPLVDPFLSFPSVDLALVTNACPTGMDCVHEVLVMVMPCKESVVGRVTNWLAEPVNMQFSTAQWLRTRSGLANLFEGLLPNCM